MKFPKNIKNIGLGLCIFFLLGGVIYAINTIQSGYNIGKSQSKQIIAHGSCKEITNNSSIGAAFIPTKTTSEWNDLLAKKPSHLNIKNCTKSCSISNGSGLQTWSNGTWGSCTVSGCNSGYEISGNSCVEIETCPYYWNNSSIYISRSDCENKGGLNVFASPRLWDSRSDKTVCLTFSEYNIPDGCNRALGHVSNATYGSIKDHYAFTATSETCYISTAGVGMKIFDSNGGYECRLAYCNPGYAWDGSTCKKYVFYYYGSCRDGVTDNNCPTGNFYEYAATQGNADYHCRHPAYNWSGAASFTKRSGTIGQKLFKYDNGNKTHIESDPNGVDIIKRITCSTD